jgi:hypothetical protein
MYMLLKPGLLEAASLCTSRYHSDTVLQLGFTAAQLPNHSTMSDLHLHVVELEDLVKDVVGGREAGGHVVVCVRQVSLCVQGMTNTKTHSCHCDCDLQGYSRSWPSQCMQCWLSFFGQDVLICKA